MRLSSKAVALSVVMVVGVAGTLLAAEKSEADLNHLTKKEEKAGWKLLFDGKTLTGWRSYGKPDAPKQGWVIEDGVLKCVARGNGGDIITVDKYNDFELQWDWKIAPKANNGVKYLVTEARPTAPGQEYQMIDDATANEPPKRSTASFYDVLPPDAKKPLKPAGEWNQSKILIQGNRVEHWLNGKKVLSYELGSPETKAAVASSKFKNAAGFGEKIEGHILLTYHNDEAFYRNIKIRKLSSK